MWATPCFLVTVIGLFDVIWLTIVVVLLVETAVLLCIPKGVVHSVGRSINDGLQQHPYNETSPLLTFDQQGGCLFFALSSVILLRLLQSPHALNTFEEIGLYQSAAGKIENKGQPKSMVSQIRR